MPFTPYSPTSSGAPTKQPTGFTPYGSQGSKPNSAPASLSASQFILNGLKGFGNTIDEIGKETGDQYKQGAEDITGDLKANDPTSLKSEIETGANVAGDFAKTVFAPFTGVINTLSEKASDNPEVQKFAQSGPVSALLNASDKGSAKINEWATANPEKAKAVQDFFNVAGLALGGAGDATDIMGAAKGTGEAAKGAAESVAKAPSSIVKAIQDAKAAKTAKATDLIKEPVKAPEAADKEAWDIIKPKTSAKVAEAYRATGNVKPRGLFSEEKLTPNAQDTKIMEAVRPLVQSGELTKGMAPVEQISTIARNVSRINQDVKGFVADHNVPIEMKSIDDKLAAVKANNPKVFGDAASAYDDVIAKAKSFLKTGQQTIDAETGVAKMEPNTKGATIDAETGEKTSEPAEANTHTDGKSILDARQAFDKWAEKNVRGAFKRDANGLLSDSDNARVMAIRDVRDAFNDSVADSLPANSPYKSMLTNESRLMRAVENINENAGNLQKSKIGELVQKHKWIAKALFWGFGAGAVIEGAANKL